MRQKLSLTDKNKHNVIYWCNFIREVGEQYLKAHPQQLGCFHDDGRLIVVEISQSTSTKNTIVSNGERGIECLEP